MKLIAFDSGIQRTGFALFNKNSNQYSVEEYGCIETDRNENIEKRIFQIVSKVEELVNNFDPELFVFEQIFFNLNKKTAISVAQSQGALMSFAAKKNIKIHFITPLQIKQCLTGYGNADKKNVQKMVKILLNLKEIPQPDDTADAIACGLAYCTIKKFE